jgi:DNA-binding response OmpR family regulator
VTGVQLAESRKGSKSYILVVAEDDAAQPIGRYLERAGYDVSIVGTVADMRAAIEAGSVGVVILDVGLPDGWDALRWLRARGALPVLLLAARDEPLDQIIGLELGADAYLATPLDLRELLARLRGIQRRAGRAPSSWPAHEEPLRFSGWVLDPASQQLRSEGGEFVHLTEAEYRILVLLVRHPHRAIGRDRLMAATGREWTRADRSIDFHITNLRRKLDLDPAQPSLIRTVRGAGYMFVPKRA